MSKLGDRIRKAMRQEAVPIGFRAVRPQKNPQMLVVVQIDEDNLAKASQAVEKGANALIVKDGKPGSLKTVLALPGETPVGVWPKKADVDARKALVEAGADFLVFDAESTPATTLLEEKLGFVLTLRSGADENYLRVLESAVLDAVLLEDYVGPLTVQRQLELRLVAVLSRKPLMAPVTLPIDGPDLECLRDAGIILLLADAADSKTLDELPNVLKAIEELPGPRHRRETALEAILPRAVEMAGEEGEEEEGEEE
jgi:hypothetical protein